MKESPIQASIGFIIDILGLRPGNFDGIIETPGVISDIPGIEDLPNAIDNVPDGGYGIFPLPPTNPGSQTPGFFPPPQSNPNPRPGSPLDGSEVPQDVWDALAGL